METCKHGSGAGSRKPTAEMRQGTECRAYACSNQLFQTKKLKIICEIGKEVTYSWIVTVT